MESAIVLASRRTADIVSQSLSTLPYLHLRLSLEVQPTGQHLAGDIPFDLNARSLGIVAGRFATANDYVVATPSAAGCDDIAGKRIRVASRLANRAAHPASTADT
jgi:hypothetical protein